MNNRHTFVICSLSFCDICLHKESKIGSLSLFLAYLSTNRIQICIDVMYIYIYIYIVQLKGEEKNVSFISLHRMIDISAHDSFLLSMFVDH